MLRFEESLPHMLYRTLDAIMPAYRTLLDEFGLTQQQWRVLRLLWTQGPMTSAQIARRAFFTRSSMVGILDRLEARGLIAFLSSHS